MARSKATLFPLPIRDVFTRVGAVHKDRLSLIIDSLECDAHMELSPRIALSLHPVPTDSRKTDLNMEFYPGDTMNLDIIRDGDIDGRYIPLKIHSFYRTRMDGMYVNGIGLIIDQRSHGYVIRTKALPHDLICSIFNITNHPDKGSAIGRIAIFEAMSDRILFDSYGQYFRCLQIRLCPLTVTDAGFPYYSHTTGKIIHGDSEGSFRVDFTIDTTLPDTVMIDRSLPIVDSLVADADFFDGGDYDEDDDEDEEPVVFSALTGEYVSCMVCAQQPHGAKQFTFEVVSIGAVEKRVRLSDYEWDPSTVPDGILYSLEGTMGHRYLECNQNYNQVIERTLGDSFLFILQHARPKLFERLVDKYPMITKTLAELAQLELDEDGEEPVGT